MVPDEQIDTARLQHGVWTSRQSLVIAAILSDGVGYLTFHSENGIAHRHNRQFDTVDSLVDAMRQIEPDIRRWH